MRRLIVAILIALLAILPPVMHAPAAASPAEEYAGPYFGDRNLPPGCLRDMSPPEDNPDNICHHMRTDLNGLDSPQVDVLVMVPVSPTAERDMRVMRQSVEMWEGGIDYLADEMGLEWLTKGMDFHVTVDYVDVSGGESGEFTTYPIVDPEIVVIATNPVGGIGIGIDPVDFVFTNEDAVPCHTVQNPFDFQYWESLPGFDNHHESRTGTFNEDCDGAGGNICFAVNGAIDPAPGQLDIFGLFDLVSHEFGHCLTLGHVGDGAEGDWGVVPTNDIMAYSTDPPGLTKCVSTLDVEAVAIRMSNYLDVNADGAVTAADVRLANDQRGQGGNPFQVQHPGDHLYASATGTPTDCPQPDLGEVPGARTDWTPDPTVTTKPVLTVDTPEEGDASTDGVFDVEGSVQHVPLNVEPAPTRTTASHDDPDDDATSPLTEIQDVTVESTLTHINATVRIDTLWPSTDLASATSYSLLVDGRRFDSFVRYPIDSNPKTWDSSAGAYMPDGTSTWDLDANTVHFQIPRDYLTMNGVDAPYTLTASANFGTLLAIVTDDSAPDAGSELEIAGAKTVYVPLNAVTARDQSETITFEHERGNTFYPEESTLGATPLLFSETGHEFGLKVTQPSTVEFNLTWTDEVGGADLDLYVSGADDSGSNGATAAPSESFLAEDVLGHLTIRVEPFLITDPVNGSTYTLTARVVPYPDADTDGVPDVFDDCPDVAGNGRDGCPIVATEHVRVYVDGALVATDDIDTAYGPDHFDLSVTIPTGTHTLRVAWEDQGRVIASDTFTVTHGPSPPGPPSETRGRRPTD